ncbi:MAG: hypothetical protein AAGA44_16490 [Pseudomonadota bacterium]
MASTRLLPSLIASGACGFLASPAMALQLGEIDVQSGLGQPLRASIAFALSPNERLDDYCIFLRPNNVAAGLPAISQARLSVSGSRIVIEGQTPLKEPMISLGLAVNCPYTANLARSYTIMLDPVAVTPQNAVPPVEASEQTPASEPAPEPVIRRRTAPVTSTSIGPSSTYRVRSGDSLSTIVGRVENRELGLWDAVEVVFAANPDAFIDGDMNKLKAGSLLTIPSLDGESVAVVTEERTAAAEPAAAPTAATASAAATDGYEGFAADDTTAASGTDAADTSIPAEPAAASAAEPVVDVVLDQTVDLRPGDVSFGPDPAFTAPIEVPVTPEAVAVTPEASTPATGNGAPGNLLYLLVGSGLGLLAGLLIFGRRFRRSEPLPPAPVEDAKVIADDDPTAQNQALDQADVDFDIGDMSDAVAVGKLDADLAAGTGFDAESDVEVAQDWAFSTSHDLGADLDMELPEVTNEGDEDETSTDIIPLQRTEEQSILEREILPTDDDEYDLSIIVDATKERYSEDGDVTARELQAVAVDSDDIEEGDEEYTLSNEVDYQILEQDYEDELSATQALNAEIQRAADDLTSRLEADADEDTEEVTAIEQTDVITAEQTALLDADEMLSEDATTEMPAVTEGAEKTVELAKAEDSDDDEAPIEGDRTEEIPAATTESRRRLDETMAATELTEELPSAQNDSTAEIEVESGHFRTRKTANE